jgi:hypothetical protein
MTTISQLLADFERRGISLTLDGNNLRYSARSETLGQEDVVRIKDAESEIISTLRARTAARFPVPKNSASALEPSHGQLEWWRWRKDSPIQLCDEKLSIVTWVRDVSSSKIREILKDLVSNNSVLRTSMRDGACGPEILLNNAADFPIEIEELPPVDTRELMQSTAMDRATEFVNDTLLIGAPWVMKAKLIVTSFDEILVALVFHHLIVDGPSISIIRADLESAFQKKPGRNMGADDPKLQLADYAQSERLWFSGPEGQVLIDYWRKWLQKQSKLRSPSGALLQWQPGLNVSVSFLLSNDVMDLIQTVATKSRIIPFSFFLTVFAICLSRWSGQNHFPIRCIGSLRGTNAPASIVGNLVTADPIEIYVEPGSDFLSTLQSITNEYVSSAQMRLPNLLNFPAHPMYPGIELERFTGDIAATMNYFSTGQRRSVRGAASDDGAFDKAPWPPAVTRGELEKWSVPLWPMIFRLYDMGTEVRGIFQFNQALISEREQMELISNFFETLRESVMILCTRVQASSASQAPSV